MMGAATEKARLPRFSFVLGVESVGTITTIVHTVVVYCNLTHWV